jgi:BirA family biotin operon repressor/biotin-[acetyl-CoA-carboxylase] ligase
MKIIKVDATTSTNELSKTLNSQEITENFCVSTEFQINGRGHQNSSWQSGKSKNLMFTVVYNDLNLNLEKRFCLNALVCLNLYNVLKKLNIGNLKLKWPNDILADNYKICGILIENTIVGTTVRNSYVGVGLNVNQAQFEKLPNASSLKLLTGINFDRDELLNNIIEEFKDLPQELLSNSPQNIINVYKRYLYGYNFTTEFILPNSNLNKGKIKNVGLDGKLAVKFESGITSRFEHKAIRQLY